MFDHSLGEGMKVYKVKQGIIIEQEGSLRLLSDEPWDHFVNDDQLHQKISRIIGRTSPDPEAGDFLAHDLRPPIQSQEIWASGVTYLRSKVGRQEESKKTGGSDFYARVYEAERPELFFKAGAHRTVGSGEAVRIRKDSTWNVPEPELTLVITSSGKIAGTRSAMI